MASKRDYYHILGISKGASEKEIKGAYRTLAHQYHPDKNPGDKKAEEAFKEATEAYSVLSDPEKRSAYDRFGHAGVQNGGFSDMGGVDLSDLFGSVFGDMFGGGQRRGSRRQKGADLEHLVELTFEEAAFGAEKEIQFKTQDACEPCQGTGAKAGSKPVTCKACHGHGQVHISQGFFAISQTCPSCQGSGQMIGDPCGTCKGQKLVSKIKKLKVNIPAGISEATSLRLSQEGGAGLSGGPRGDLYVTVKIKPHPIFEREGYSVLCKVPISFTQAALGAVISVPTLYGKVDLPIEAGTQSGTVFKLAGKGIPHLSRSNSKNKTGDQVVQLFVEVPKHLSKEQKELLTRFAETNAEQVSSECKSFFDKVKELFG